MRIRMIDSKIQCLANRLGYSITRVTRVDPDLSLYDGVPAESLSQHHFYNIGAGLFLHPYWTNIDYGTPWYSVAQRHPFINYNLMDLVPLPVKSNVAEIVYSSHTIEHVSDEAVRNMLREAHRILKPGGYIRLTTPDMALECGAYKRGDRRFYYWIPAYSRQGCWERFCKIPLSEATIHQVFLSHFATPLSEISVDDSPDKKFSDTEIKEIFSTYPMEKALDYFTQRCRYNPILPGSHINWWTENKLVAFLKEAGFSECYRSGYGQSKAPPLRDISLFDKTHPKISLYIEAIKNTPAVGGHSSLE